MLKKIFLAVLGLLCFGFAFFIFRFTVLLPRDIPVPDVVIPTDAASIERGRYLATHVAVCMDCHSQRDWSYYSGPIVEGSLGMGGQVFDQSVGMPGVLISKNITPHALGDWSDGELFRAITGGLQNDGDALFPVMPYDAYRVMETDDVLAIISYLRTLAPIENDTPDHQLEMRTVFAQPDAVGILAERNEQGRIHPYDDGRNEISSAPFRNLDDCRVCILTDSQRIPWEAREEHTPQVF